MEQSIGPVTLQGPGAEDLAFRSMEFFEAVSTPFRYTVDVLSDKPDLAAETYLGKALSVILQIDEKNSRIFSGIITEFGLHGRIGQNTLYRLVLEPWLALLQLVSNCRIFQDQSVPDIVMDVFRKHGFSGDVEPRLSVPHEPRPYVVQYRESDFNFVCRLLEDEGIYFFFQHGPGQHTLVLCDALAAHKPAPGCDKLPYYPPDLNRTLHIDYIDRWQVNSRVESGAYGLRDFNFEDASAEKDATHEDAAQHPNGAFELYDYPGIYKAPGAGKVIAKRRLQEVQATRSRAEGHANARGLLVGALLTLEEHPVPSQNRQYLMLSLSGSVSTHALESGGDDVDVYVCNFECIDTKLPFQPPRRTPKPIVHGAQTAIVVGGANSEIFTDDYGRVLLMFHWDRDSPGNQDSSCWVRVAQAWAGSGFGAVFTPRVGHEVLVDFLEGDPDRPIVTGSVYNSDNKPPYLPLNASQSGIKTRSTLKGTTDNFNEIRFEDKKGEEELYIQAEKTQTTKVKGSQGITVDGSRSVSVGGDQSTTVTKNETQTYKADRKMDVTGTDTNTITGAHSGTYKAGRTQTVSGQDDVLTVALNRTSTITGQYHIQADAEYKVTHKNNVILLSGTKAEVTNGKCKITMDGGKLMVEAPESLTIKCGDTSIALTTSECTIKGATINVDGGNGGGRVALDAVGATVTGKTKASLGSNATTEISGSVVRIN
jgi:type VI secretion system secreted protein VgrG